MIRYDAVHSHPRGAIRLQHELADQRRAATFDPETGTQVAFCGELLLQRTLTRAMLIPSLEQDLICDDMDGCQEFQMQLLRDSCKV